VLFSDNASAPASIENAPGKQETVAVETSTDGAITLPSTNNISE